MVLIEAIFIAWNNLAESVCKLASQIPVQKHDPDEPYLSVYTRRINSSVLLKPQVA